MISASWQLQQAMYGALAAEIDLQPLLGDPPAIYDTVPDAARLPYVTVERSRARAYPGLDTAEEHDIRLAIWSSYAGRREVQEVMRIVIETLHNADLALLDHTLVSLRHQFSDVSHDPGNNITSAVVRFRAVTQQLASAS